MRLTIKCPQCSIGWDIVLHKEPEPILTDYHYGNLRDCPNCDLVVHVTVEGNRKEKPEKPKLPFNPFKEMQEEK